MSLIEREKRVGLHLPVEVRGEDGAGARFTEYTRSVNVSGGGICFESHRQIAVGARLFLAIELPLSLRRHFGNRDVFRVRAVVCRVERFEREEVSRIGARFLGEAAPEEMV
ncbi:MAG TPA: PilZ domain-containing protein [Vicinamibacteria bacterium]